MIVQVGEPMDRFIYLLAGEVEIVDPHSGDRLFEAVIGPAQFLGDIGFVHASACFLGARAVSDTRTLEAPREKMLELMARVPELSDHIITVLAARRRRQFEL
jgi:thioredoxin reductase (NADPH)